MSIRRSSRPRGSASRPTTAREAPSAGPPGPAPQADAPTPPGHALIRRQVDALNRHDLDALMATYAEAAVLEYPASPPVCGKAAIRRAYEQFFADWDETITLGHVVAAGTIVAAEGVVAGRHRTIHLKIPGRVPVAAPRTYRHGFAAFWEIRDGLVVRHRVYYDARELVKQLLGPR
ncbi:MAG: nuclear transport factor 2 family protein [Firmicutes bacterium]|nr:nuclear transport factor 2 family protein [Bacillota bacterium]